MNKEITFLDFVVKFCFENDHRKFSDRYDEWRRGMLPTGGGKDLEDYAMGWFPKAYENALKAQRKICADLVFEDTEEEEVYNEILNAPMP